jgi:O-antigen/teichoic acid export membrane protein
MLVITVPLTLPYLGEERFGVWMTVASLAGMLIFLDLGVGNGLVSYIARIRATGTNEDIKYAITRSLLLLSLIGISVGALLVILNLWWPIQDLISVESIEAAQDAEKTIWMFIGLFSIGIPMGGIYRVYNAIQESWIVNLLKAAGSIISIIAVTLIAKVEAAPHFLLLATYGVQTLMPLALLIHIVKRRWLTVVPHQDRMQAKSAYRELLSTGGLFFVLQIGTMLGWGADSLIISSLVGAAAVAQFAIAQRMYQVVSVPLSIINGPLWAAYADAKAHSDIEFVRITLKKSMIGTIALSATLSSLIFFCSGFLLEIWVGDAVDIPVSLILAFTVWKILESTGGAFSMFLNGLHIVKPQVLSVILFCAIGLPLKLSLAPEYGATAVVWSTVMAYSLAVGVFYSCVYRREILDFVRTGS